MIPASITMDMSYLSYLFSAGLKYMRIGVSLNFSFRLLKAIIAPSIYLNDCFPLSNAVIPSTTKLY